MTPEFKKKWPEQYMLPVICQKLHMHTTADDTVLDDEGYQAGLDYLKKRIEEWKSPAQLNTVAYDGVIYALCCVVIRECEEHIKQIRAYFD